MITLTKEMAVDSESYDPDLPTKGPGFLTRDSYPIGISLVNSLGEKCYLPIAHQTEGNLDSSIVKSYVQNLVSDPNRVLCFANAMYDLEALDNIGIEVKAQIYDIQVNEALIDENAFAYSLDAIANRYALGGKHKASMEEYMLSKGMSIKHKPDYTRLRELPPNVVGPYAEIDAVLTLKIYELQKKHIKEQNLEQVSKLESKLAPLLWRMRKKGIRVDTKKAEEINYRMMIAGYDLLKATGLDIDPWSSAQVGEYIRKTYSLEPPRSAKKGVDSITNEWLFSLGKPDMKALAEYRQSDKIRRDFVEGLILEQSHKGRVHPRWFATRGSGFMSDNDVNGTRSGRIACTDPNLAQIPARHEIYGPLVRGLFLPEQDEQWIKLDYSSQEPRITAHYAYIMGLDGARELHNAYHKDPKLDSHQYVTDQVNKVRNKPIERKQGKTINLGIVYGMGLGKLARSLGLSDNEAKEILDSYHQGVPFVKQLLKRCSSIANERGYVKTILGRRRHFEEWENGEFGAEWSPPTNKEQALRLYDSIKRANTYKALNSIVQGTAAEQIKTAMVNLDDEGITPLVTVYDELGISGNEGTATLAKEMMEEAIKFTVPHVVDYHIGPTWSAK
jgi:DNA polymerase I-like protein with 3'-5' exonuclease and polymerase domains